MTRSERVRDVLALGSVVAAGGLAATGLAADSRRSEPSSGAWLTTTSVVVAWATGLALLADDAKPSHGAGSRWDAALSQFEESNSFVPRRHVLPWGAGALALSVAGLLRR